MAMRIVMLFFTMLSLTTASSAYGIVLIMPEELVEFAEKNGCSQVDDFYTRPGSVRPPYVYDYPNEESAVFWCQSGEENNRRFFLLIMAKHKVDESKNCPTKIEWKGGYPGGLSLLIDRHSTLDDFVYLHNPLKKGPRNVELTDNAIVSEYDGVEETFYCHKGQWLIRQRH